LAPFGAENLSEVTVLVKQTDSYQRDIQIAGGLKIVPGQHSQATGIQGDGLAQTIFHAEISHRSFDSAVRACGIKPGLIKIVLVKFGDPLQFLPKLRIGNNLLQFFLRHGLQHPPGVAGDLPFLRIYHPPELIAAMVPGPADIQSEFV